MTQREEFTEAMTGVINTAKRVAAIERFYKVVGGGIGLGGRFFGVPWLAAYAWNGMTELPDWPYLPTVAAFAVFNVLAATLRGPSK